VFFVVYPLLLYYYIIIILSEGSFLLLFFCVSIRYINESERNYKKSAKKCFICNMQYLGEITLKTKNAYSNELQRDIVQAHPRAVEQVKKFAEKFRGRNDKETAFNVWRFMRTNFEYSKDKPNQQRIFLPSAAMHFRKMDCKSFATFAGAIFTALKIPNAYKLTSYKSTTTPSHIYNIVRLDNGRYLLPVDGCFSLFGKEKKPTFAKLINLIK